MQKCVLPMVFALLTLSLAPPRVWGAPYGTIVGMVTNSAKVPVAGATVTARRADGSGIRSTVSGRDGIYSFADVTPGAWVVTSDVEGAPSTEPYSLSVAPDKPTRFDIVVEAAALASGAAAAKSPLTASVAAPTVPEALQAPEETSGVDTFTPFAYGDFTWLNGSSRSHAPVFDTKFFTPEIRFDAHYMSDSNAPVDHTIVGSTESFRSGEFQLEQVSFGGDFHWHNVRARFLSMMGLFATTTPRNDASAGVGQWDLRNAYRYLSEANAGYHFDVNHGLNVDAGIFVSYIGLFSYYNFDNWTYQPSYVSSNTPWFFNGLRIQWFPTNKLKIEPWIINGWQSYARYNGHLGYGGQILYRPYEWLSLVFNNYGVGNDNLGWPDVTRIHTDDSILVRYYNRPESAGVSKMAFSFTFDAGCQKGWVGAPDAPGSFKVHCTGGPNRSSFLGWMLYNRVWFGHDRFALTLGGGSMTNPGRYLTLLPPINGADAVSGTPYFTENPGQHAYQWDTTLNFQYMPNDWITWWAEAGYRHSDVPYFAGRGGVTPPGGNNGSPQYYTCMSGATAGTNNLAQATAACGGAGIWYPDLRLSETKLSVGVLVKF
jgi:Putative beta-barrel porin-2, OmpL-like. bbp2/Carboxypeptidase regulatory-like domain